MMNEQFFENENGEVFAFNQGVNPYDWGHAEGSLTEITKEEAISRASNSLPYDANRERAEALSLATKKVSYYEMYGNTTKVAEWRTYFIAVDQLPQDPAWPNVAFPPKPTS